MFRLNPYIDSPPEFEKQAVLDTLIAYPLVAISALAALEGSRYLLTRTPAQREEIRKKMKEISSNQYFTPALMAAGAGGGYLFGDNIFENLEKPEGKLYGTLLGTFGGGLVGKGLDFLATRQELEGTK